MPFQTKQGHATGSANKPQCLPQFGRVDISWSSFLSMVMTPMICLQMRLSFTSKQIKTLCVHIIESVLYKYLEMTQTLKYDKADV